MVREEVIDLLSQPHPISAVADALDLSGVHFFAAMLGALTAVYVMQLWTMEKITISGDCWVTFHLRRLALITIALALLWSMSYSTVRGWRPWPPDVLTILGIDGLLLSAVVVAIRRNRRSKQRGLRYPDNAS